MAAESWTYGYDDLDRLTLATDSGDSSLSQSFAYDAVGNMTSNSAVGSYTYPAPGSARPHAVTQAGSTTYGYGPDGNMTSAGGTTLACDGENRLVQAGATSFVYGPDGSRLEKAAAVDPQPVSRGCEVWHRIQRRFKPGGVRSASSATQTHGIIRRRSRAQSPGSYATMRPRCSSIGAKSRSSCSSKRRCSMQKVPMMTLAVFRIVIPRSRSLR